MLNIDYLNLKGIFSSVATVATSGKLSKENFLSHLKECEFRYNNSKDAKTSEALTKWCLYKRALSYCAKIDKRSYK